MTTLKTAIGPQGSTLALKDGTVTPRIATLGFEEVAPITRAFRRMVRELDFDVCEMATTTYLCARAYGKPITALPVFVTRGLHHGAVVHHPDGGARTPKDLEGARVGVNRGWTVTTGVWARGILADAYGVDLDRVAWVRTGTEHVAEYVLPAGVATLEEGKDLAEAAAAGELAAAVGITASAHPDLSPLIPEPEEAALAALRSEGLYPLNHLVVVRDEVLEQHPDLAVDLFHAFAGAKRHYLDRLRSGALDDPGRDRVLARVMEVTGDPLPYGLALNREMLARLVGYAVQQRVLPDAPPLETLFHPSTLDLQA